MIEGVRCPPGTHKYRAHGKVVFCTACADVQALLLDEPAPPAPSNVSRETLPPPEQLPPETVPVSDEAQMAALRSLRDLVARGGVPDPEQMELLGQRGQFEGDLSELEYVPDKPRSRVDLDYRNARDEGLPAEGV